jgi:hypothetical protein
MTDSVVRNPPPERGAPHPSARINPDANLDEGRYFPCMSGHGNGTDGGPTGYGALLDAVTREITGSRARVVLAADPPSPDLPDENVRRERNTNVPY